MSERLFSKGDFLKFIDIKTLSTFLNVKRKTIYDWVHKNEIPYYKIGHLVRFNHQEIIEWLSSKKQEERESINL